MLIKFKTTTTKQKTTKQQKQSNEQYRPPKILGVNPGSSEG
jgi:hypothetical protein